MYPNLGYLCGYILRHYSFTTTKKVRFTLLQGKNDLTGTEYKYLSIVTKVYQKQ